MKHKQKYYVIPLLMIHLFLFSHCSNENPTNPQFKTLKDEVDYIVSDYIKVGGIIGIIDKQGNKQLYSYGTKVINENQPPDEYTLFEIGSVTKTFTTTLLADLFLREAASNDTVNKIFTDAKFKLPSKDGKEILIGHLATHTSGIPRTPHESGSNYSLPSDFDFESPYACYEAEDVYDYLTNYCELEFTPGTFWEYSNTGMGLLGHILGRLDGTSYNEILQKYIFDELDMKYSAIYPTESQMLNFAEGYKDDFIPGYYFIANDIFQGAGSIKSSAHDLLIYLEVQMGMKDTRLKDAIELTHQIQLHQGSMGEQALAWLIMDLEDDQTITYHGGDTYSYSAYLGFNSTEKTAVVVLLNYGTHGDELIIGPKILSAILKY